MNGRVLVGMALDATAAVEDNKARLVGVVTGLLKSDREINAGRFVTGGMDEVGIVLSDPKSSSTFAHSWIVYGVL